MSPNVCRAFLGCQVEEAVDELNLPKKIISCHPSNLPLADHVDCFVALNHSPSRMEFSETLLGVHAAFDGSMILFENVVQVLHRSVSTAITQRSFLLTFFARIGPIPFTNPPARYRSTPSFVLGGTVLNTLALN
ncbi:MAG: hypothetical protein WBW03_16875 [Silvibacterium sp.]